MTALREGFTTGACAAAAALGCCLWQAEGECPRAVEVVLPTGRMFTPSLVAHEGHWCGVIKDAGDDPDVTHGMEVRAHVEVLPYAGGIRFIAGAGVGVITREGLKLPIGEAAINPVPREMIEASVRKVYKDSAMAITISIPGGDIVAQRTFNPRLGVVGGLSILGTTGIVRPMSEDAIIDTIKLELSTQRAAGHDHIALAFGQQGEAALIKALPEFRGKVVQMSNFVGATLDAAREMGFSRLTIAGHPGKLVKVSGGSMQTHSKIGDGRREAVITQLALLGAPKDLIDGIYRCITTEAMMPLIERAGYGKVWTNLAIAAQDYCKARIGFAIEISAIMLSGKDGMLGKSL